MTTQRTQGNRGRRQGQNGGQGGRDLLNSPGYLEGLMTNSDMPNVAKELVHPGKSGDPLELLMRCIIKDERQLNAIVQYLALCDEFNLPQEKKALLFRLAGSVSIGGIARRELLMAATNLLAPSFYEIGTTVKGKRRDGKKEKEDEKDQGGA